MDDPVFGVVLRVEGLSKRFGNRQVLNNVSFEVERGSIFALVGPNGVGKTTTIRCIVGAVEPDGGRIELFGRVDGADLKRSIAVVPEERKAFKNFTASDYEKLWSTLYPTWDSVRFSDFMARYGFDMRQRIETYSTGMRTLFAVALAISSGAELLILDEPTQHLDPPTRLEIMNLLKDCARSGRTILISSHEIFELEEYATHFAILKQGRIIYADTVDEAKEKHRVVSKGEELVKGTVIGKVGDEVLVRVEDTSTVGRFPRLNDIVVGYLSNSP